MPACFQPVIVFDHVEPMSDNYISITNEHRVLEKKYHDSMSSLDCGAGDHNINHLLDFYSAPFASTVERKHLNPRDLYSIWRGHVIQLGGHKHPSLGVATPV